MGSKYTMVLSVGVMWLVFIIIDHRIMSVMMLGG